MSPRRARELRHRRRRRRRLTRPSPARTCPRQVTRDGAEEEIDRKDLRVGDVLHIRYGEAIPVDGLCIEGNSWEVNESSLTGEPDACADPRAPAWPLLGCPPSRRSGRERAP